MLLVLRRHVRRTHRALERLAAGPDAVAHFDRGGESALLGEVEQGLRLPRRVLRAVAQVVGDTGGREDVARIYPVVGDQGALELAEGLPDARAVHPLEEGGARPAAAAVARDPAAAS